VKLITGERVVTAEGGFNSSYQRHVATYRLIAGLLPEGRVLDLGCGTGHSYKELAPRETVGIDRNVEALAGQERDTHVADMRDIPFPDGSFASVICVQAIEHVPDARPVLAEVVRVLEPGGTAVFATPNRLEFALPDEIVDPYHYVEYDPRELHDLCAPWFERVEMLGLDGSAAWRSLVADEQAQMRRVLRLDPLRLRRLVPRRARQMLYDWSLTRSRVGDADPRAAAVTADDFRLVTENVDRAYDLVAVCVAPGGTNTTNSPTSTRR
jgi:SAM-dependent methyltransferase